MNNWSESSITIFYIISDKCFHDHRKIKDTEFCILYKRYKYILIQLWKYLNIALLKGIIIVELREDDQVAHHNFVTNHMT